MTHVRAALDILCIVAMVFECLRLVLLATAADPNSIVANHASRNTGPARFGALLAAALWGYLLSRFVGWL